MDKYSLASAICALEGSVELVTSITGSDWYCTHEGLLLRSVFYFVHI